MADEHQPPPKKVKQEPQEPPEQPAPDQPPVEEGAEGEGEEGDILIYEEFTPQIKDEARQNLAELKAMVSLMNINECLWILISCEYV